MIDFLKQYGDLTPDKLYKGSSRSGYAMPRGAGREPGTPNDPLPLSLLLDEDLWNGVLFEDIIDQQATMFQPVGGMDRIPMAFAKALGNLIHYECEVTHIGRRGEGVRIAYTHKPSGAARTLDADYCIVAMPTPVVAKIPSDFSPAYRAALAGIEWQNSVKIAWQSRRFWEQDYDIYGGISLVDYKGINMVWYIERVAVQRTGHRAGLCTAAQPERREARGIAAPGAVRDDARRDRAPAPGPRQGAAPADGHRVVEGAVFARRIGVLPARPGRGIRHAEPAGRPVLLLRRLPQQDRHVAGKRDDLRAAHDQPARREASRGCSDPDGQAGRPACRRPAQCIRPCGISR